MEVQVFDSRAAAEAAVADEIAQLVRQHPTAVLGLASGDSPTGVYREMVRRHHEGTLDLAGVQTFNLDEYLGLDPEDARSFRSYMRTHLLEPTGISTARAHFPGGWGPPPQQPDVESHCQAFEELIRRAGGIDLQLLGIGRNGHIGFNEPGSVRSSRTRVVELAAMTRLDAAGSSADIARIPTHAITMGVATLLDARRIRVLAFGARKRDIVARTLRSPADPAWPASFLHEHPDVRLVIDREAAQDAL